MDIESLKYGEAVHDMHNGFPDLESKFGVRVKQHIRIDMTGGSGVIASMLTTRPIDQRASEMYINKMLVFVGEHYNGTTLCFQFAYSYDDRVFGLIEAS